MGAPEVLHGIYGRQPHHHHGDSPASTLTECINGLFYHCNNISCTVHLCFSTVTESESPHEFTRVSLEYKY